MTVICHGYLFLSSPWLGRARLSDFRGVCVCRKLRATLDEYTTRVGQQAIVLCISPSKPNALFKVFGAAPLENVVSANMSATRQPHRRMMCCRLIMCGWICNTEEKGVSVSYKECVHCSCLTLGLKQWPSSTFLSASALLSFIGWSKRWSVIGESSRLKHRLRSTRAFPFLTSRKRRMHFENISVDK